MSRKTASFSQLINYINKGRNKNDVYSFRHNIYAHKIHSIIKEYQENYKILKKRKNGNALYHDIIALKRQNNLTIEEQREILKDLAEQYTAIRAGYNLVYAVIHEKENNMHCHLVISSNEVESQRNKRLDKKQFGNIKEKLREYAYDKYPKLEKTEKEKRKTRTKTKTIDNEIQFKRRTGKQSDKEVMKERLQAIFANSQDQQSLVNNLQTENIKIYQRGNTFGFLDTSTGKKYRLKTLELEDEFHKLNDRLTKQATNTKQGEETMNAHYQDTSEFRKADVFIAQDTANNKEKYRQQLMKIAENKKSEAKHSKAHAHSKK